MGLPYLFSRSAKCRAVSAQSGSPPRRAQRSEISGGWNEDEDEDEDEEELLLLSAAFAVPLPLPPSGCCDQRTGAEPRTCTSAAAGPSGHHQRGGEDVEDF